MVILLRFAAGCLLLMIAVGCAAEATTPPDLSTVAVVESADTPAAVATSTTTPTATDEPPPTVEPTSTPDVAEAETEPDKNAATAIDISMTLPVGDPQHGEELLEAKACAGCHFLGRVGAAPSWKAEIYAKGKGIATRAGERWQLANYTGNATSETEYLVESILMPNAYVIDGFMGGEMPQSYRELLTDQELADIISYLLEIE